MRFAAWQNRGGVVDLDPAPYLTWLATNASVLPKGARRFAADPHHYDYGAFRTIDSDLPPGTALCTKDLLLRSAEVLPREHLAVELGFLFPGFEFDDVGAFDLILRYSTVTRFEAHEHPNHAQRSPSGLGRLLIDEVVPGAHGIVHELVFEQGSIVVEAADLRSTWR